MYFFRFGASGFLSLVLGFCFAMGYGCYSGGDSGSIVVVIYCVRYIIFLCCLYYFNVLTINIKPLL